MKEQGATLWLTGLPCSGKSTLAQALAQRLRGMGKKVEVIDGDIIRKELCRDLGFSRKDREENIRRVGFLCSMLSRNGVFAIAALISPFRKSREALRSKIENFVEIYVDCPLEVCMQRDVKGMYKKALKGEIKNFTGISDPYEPPTSPEVYVNTAVESVEACLNKILSYLKEKKLID